MVTIQDLFILLCMGQIDVQADHKLAGACQGVRVCVVCLCPVHLDCTWIHHARHWAW